MDPVPLAASRCASCFPATSPGRIDARAGNILYYESDRDGSWCVCAQRLQRATMRAIGPPVAIHHAHSARMSIGNIGLLNRGLAASRDRVVFNTAEMTGNIWMTEFRGR